ncbi:MAG: HrpE/YscL family type III secretion apparatus protein [Planctomycetota bacterium]|jgi:type III secretion protein L|nr:HrpE/YscL family type III secretion apparatus protein [Planctomycetota bacterium]
MLLIKDSVVPEPGTMVLKAGEYAVMAEANAVLAQASARAGEIVALAEADAEAERRRGYEAGVAEGKAEVAERMFETMAASVEHLSGMESTLVDLVMRSLRTVLGTFDREELAVETVRHALRLVRDEKRVVLRVAAADADCVAKRLDEIVRRYPGMGRVDLVPDASLGSGGCVMETEIGVIDASLDRQLAMIENSFRRQLEERRG